jgi:HD-GYP domain-containing protein (c-di-GMP phosphodiesterase class II)
MYRNKLLQSKSVRNEILISLETALHERTQETEAHAQRMNDLAVEFGHYLQLLSSELDRLMILARLHDIGKVGIPDAILSKAGPLSQEEWEIIKKHPEIGYRIAQTSLQLSSVAEDILHHHERWDGTGYPKGLKGEEIPRLAQIIAIVDSYDVMTHERSYKKAMSREEALEEVRRCAGTQFNPRLAARFVDYMQIKIMTQG